ncbi:flagellar filament capping protein FliD [Candidatus Latescibacterota bacterium]
MAGIGSVNFDGLASGLDTKKIIEDLLNVDSRPLKRLEERQSDLKEKSNIFDTMKTNLLELKDKAFEVKNTSTLGIFSASSSDEEALTLNVSATAVAGNYSITILSLAQAETLSSNSFEETNTDLGLTGEILINGNSFKVRTTDSLIDIRNAINSLDVGVNANILKVSDSDNRLIISSEQQGTEGFIIANAGSHDILGTLGITDDTKNVRKIQNGNVLSAHFDSSGSTIGSLTGLSSEASGNVKIRNKSFFIDLSTDTLSSIRDKINNLNIAGVTASVEPVDINDETKYRLEITGTEDFTDDGNVLETLGILAGGTSGTRAEFETSTIYIIDSNNEAQENTKLSKVGAVIGEIPETITISGTNTDGSEVTKSIEIQQNTSIGDVLKEIEEAFSDNVTAYIDDGKIKIRSNISGKTSLDIDITANNENGGTLDFGIIKAVVVGRDRLIVEGSDAKILVNNVEVTRNTNEIDDVLSGLSLNLKKADPEKEINITVTRDQGAIFEKINGFVESYNKFIKYVNENSQYDREKNVAGPLLGDMTTRTAVYRIQNILQGTIDDSDLAFNQLALIGIELTAEGQLKLDSAKLNDAMNTDIDSVLQLFTLSRSSSDNDIAFVYNSSKTTPGTYDVTITRAAEKAEAVSDAFEGAVGEQGTITIADNNNNSLLVNYSEDMNVNDIVNLINEEAQNTYAELLESSIALQQSQGKGPIDQNTAIGDIDGVLVEENDTITINGTDRRGKSFQRIITLSNGDSHTIQDILDSIEDATSNDVNASIDSDGHIVVQDKTAGSSDIGVTIETTVEGLDFGEFITIQEGRDRVNIGASVTDNNRLRINHIHYGSEKTFTISGAASLGIEDNEYTGVDVAGTINGVEGTGSGQALTISDSDESARDIVISVSITPEELEIEGPDQGTVTLLSGIADRMFSEVSSLTNIVDGFVKVRIDSLQLEIDSIQSRVDVTNQRLEQRREMYVRRFTKMEMELSRLQSMQQRLSASLSALPQASLFND